MVAKLEFENSEKSRQEHKVIMWFRNDLRLSDNVAFDEACKSGMVVPIYILDPANNLGEATKWWLNKSLQQLNLSLENQLTIYEGNKFEVLPEILEKNHATKIFWNVDFERFPQEKELEKLCRKLDVEHHSYNCSLLWNPATILKNDGSTYKVFTPFYRKGCLPSGQPRAPISAPTNFQACKSAVESNYNFVAENWHQKLEKYWNTSENIDKKDWLIGEAAAMDRLKRFCLSGFLASTGESVQVDANQKHDVKGHRADVDQEGRQIVGDASVAQFGPSYAPQHHPVNYDGTAVGLLNYKEGRNFPGKANCSALSPHLHFGEVSPNQVWYYAKEICEKSQSRDNSLQKELEKFSADIEKAASGAQRDKLKAKIEKIAHNHDSMSISNADLDHFLSELGWREFSYYILHHFPELPSKNFQSKFDKFRWASNETNLRSWKKGQTGYPIVDAGMRELWQTGYMHNRVRMIVASFLVKNLLIDWRVGEAWFWNCLVDADLGSNSASWQWVAGTGTDAAPYFRVFNPVLQGEKFDPEGAYTLKYVPELANLPKKYLFCPFDAPEHVLEYAEITLGVNYPKPIVDIDTSREKALQEYKKISPKLEV